MVHHVWARAFDLLSLLSVLRSSSLSSNGPQLTDEMLVYKLTKDQVGWAGETMGCYLSFPKEWKASFLPIVFPQHETRLMIVLELS